MNQDNKNLFITIVLSLAVLVGFQYFYEAPRQEKARALLEQQKAQEVDVGDTLRVQPKQDTATDIPGKPVDRKQIISSENGHGQRIEIDTPSLKGSFRLEGGRLDDLTLSNYKIDTKPDSLDVELLSPIGSVQPYFVDFGWLSTNPKFEMPDTKTHWTADSKKLTVDHPVTLTYRSPQNLTFIREISVDKDYMFTVKQKVINQSGQDLDLSPYGLISRHNPPPALGYYILHEGPLGVMNNKLEEVKYKDLEDKNTQSFQSEGGWLGITDKYWLVSLIPDQSLKVNARVTKAPAKSNYQVDYSANALHVQNGAQIENTFHIFAGAKEVDLLDQYEEQYNIPKFDLAIDFGWFYFLTKPFFYGLDFIAKLVGNFGIAILVFTVILKAILFPLANKSYKAMSKMKKLQPQMEAIKQKCGDDRAKLNQEVMDLYKREKVNPASGCLPILVQIPIFFALYKVLFVTIEMRQAPFYGWIKDLSAPDPTSLFNLFGLIPWDPPSFLMIGIWPLIMGATMYLQQKLNPTPPDPVQQKVFMIMPFMFTFMLASFPAGLVIYWAWNNMLSILQQWMIMRRNHVPIL